MTLYNMATEKTKTKKEAEPIATDTPIRVEASTRKEATAKVKALLEQAKKEGLVTDCSGFVIFDEQNLSFYSNLIFNNPKNI